MHRRRSRFAKHSPLILEVLEQRQLLNAAPIVDTFLSTPASPITIGQVAVLSVTASDPDLGDKVSEVAFFEDRNGNSIGEVDELLGIDTDGIDGWSCQWDTKGHSIGSAALLAVATDVGRMASAPKPLGVSLAAPANQPPLITTFQVTPPSPISSGQLVSLSATATDSDAGDQVGTVQFLEDSDGDGVGDRLLGTDNDGTDGWSCQWDTTGHVLGVTNVQAIAFDSARLASPTATLGITITAAANQQPAVTTFQSLPPSPLNVGQLVVLFATATDPDPGDQVTKVEFYEDSNNDGVGDRLIGGDANGADGWSFLWDTTDYTPGATNLLAVAWDTKMLASDAMPLSITLNPRQSGPSTCGVYDPLASKFYLRYSNSEGLANTTFGYGAPGWKPVAGDWDGDGRDTIGLFQPEASHFYLRNFNNSGPSNVDFGYGDPARADQYVLVMGDWNGDGVDTIGLYDKASAYWFLRNTNSEGVADVTVGFGVPGSNWQPLVGDWNGDGIVTIGLYDPATGMFYLRNSQTTGVADIAFPYGNPGSDWVPLIGDWDGDGSESAGFYQPGAASHFYLRNAFTAGLADVHFGLGFAGVQPIVGNWLGAGGLPLVAAVGSDSITLAPRRSSSAPLSNPQSLIPLIAEAINRWQAAGVNIVTPQVMVADLPGNQLGAALAGTIYLDRDAAGWGWFVDPTPAVDEEFASGRAIDARAVDRIDLLTVIEHELGHLAGLSDLDAALDDLMSASLPTGVRRRV